MSRLWAVELRHRKNLHFSHLQKLSNLSSSSSSSSSSRIVFCGGDYSYSELIHILFPFVRCETDFFSFQKKGRERETDKFYNFEATTTYNFNEVHKNITIAWKMDI